MALGWSAMYLFAQDLDFNWSNLELAKKVEP